MKYTLNSYTIVVAASKKLHMTRVYGIHFAVILHTLILLNSFIGYGQNYYITFKIYRFFKKFFKVFKCKAFFHTRYLCRFACKLSR